MNERSSSQSAEDQGAHQSAQSGSQFEHTVLETLAKFGKQLDSMTARVKGNDDGGHKVMDVLLF